MEDKESGQIEDIHGEVKGSREQLGRIGERTRNIQSSVEDVADEVQSNRNDINDLEEKVKRNSTIINAVTIGLSGIALWAADKISRINPF